MSESELVVLAHGVKVESVGEFVHAFELLFARHFVPLVHVNAENVEFILDGHARPLVRVNSLGTLEQRLVAFLALCAHLVVAQPDSALVDRGPVNAHKVVV